VFQVLQDKMEMKSDELTNMESTLNLLKTRCGPSEVKAIAKQLTSLQNKLQAYLEKAKKVKRI